MITEDQKKNLDATVASIISTCGKTYPQHLARAMAIERLKGVIITVVFVLQSDDITKGDFTSHLLTDEYMKKIEEDLL